MYSDAIGQGAPQIMTLVHHGTLMDVTCSLSVIERVCVDCIGMVFGEPKQKQNKFTLMVKFIKQLRILDRSLRMPVKMLLLKVV